MDSSSLVRRRRQLVGLEGLQQVRVGCDDAEVRTEELVRRARVEVGTQLPAVDRCVRCQVHPVDVQHGAGVVDRDEPGPVRQLGTDVVDGQLPGHRVEVGSAHLSAS
jgi:hypothetical protein